MIEKLDGNKVLSRSRGFTTKTCIDVASNSQTDTSGKIMAPQASMLELYLNICLKRLTLKY